MSTSRPASLDNWKANKQHTITLHSGTKVVIEIPNLAVLIKTGKIPNALVETALELQTQDKKVTKDDLLEQYEFAALLVSLTVKEPTLAPEDVDQLPFEDVELIAQIALRDRDMDAVAHHIGGLETVESFRDIRGL